MKEVISFQILEPQQKGSFSEQLQSLKIALRELMQQQGLTPAHLVFTRVYLTDAANQWEELCMHPLYTCYLSVGAVSRIEQPLLDGSKVALQLWFVTERYCEIRHSGVYGNHNSSVFDDIPFSAFQRMRGSR